eukprot:12746182-Heterocapsa_arctica.AAC.1
MARLSEAEGGLAASLSALFGVMKPWFSPGSLGCRLCSCSNLAALSVSMPAASKTARRASLSASMARQQVWLVCG